MSATPPAVTRITLVRHGEVRDCDHFYGRLPGYWLGPPGQEQAQAAAEVLAEADPTAVCSSPLLRARQTAMAIAERHPRAPFMIDDRLVEVFTPFDGRPKEDLAALNYDLYSGVPAPYEQPAEVLARMWDFIGSMARAHSGGHLVAVSHGDPILFVLLSVGGLAAVPANRNRTAEIGLPEAYPATCSLVTLTLEHQDQDLHATRVRYRNPWAGIEGDVKCARTEKQNP